MVHYPKLAGQYGRKKILPLCPFVSMFVKFVSLYIISQYPDFLRRKSRAIVVVRSSWQGEVAKQGQYFSML